MMTKKTQNWIWLGIVAFLFTQGNSAGVAGNEFENECLETLDIPALGRVVGIGTMYSAVRNEFSSHIFLKDIDKIPSTLIRTLEKTSTITDVLIPGTFRERFRLLNIHGSTALRILTKEEKFSDGIAKKLFPIQEASSGYSCGRKFTGSLLLTHTTDVQDLQISTKEAKENINKNVVENEESTHVVTSITWGASLLAKFETGEINVTDLQAASSELKKYLQGSTDDALNSNISLSTLDVLSSGFKTQHYKSENFNIRTHRPTFIKSDFTNEGKGIPLSYKLTPIQVIRDIMYSSEDIKLHESAKISNNIVNRFADIFDSISETEKELCKFQATIQRAKEPHDQCLHPQGNFNLENLFHSIQNSFNDFKTLLMKTYSNIQDDPSQVSQLTKLLQRYENNEFDFCPRKVQAEIKKVQDQRKKMEECDYLKNKYSNIDYFGISQKNLDDKKKENNDKVIYMLFKTGNDDKSRWSSNLNIFVNTLDKPYNKLFIVDCTLFSFSECSGVSQTVIKQMIDGKFTLSGNDVAEQLNAIKQKSLKPLEIPALGRFAEIGELFDARKETFQKLSILNENPAENTTAERLVDNGQVYSVESEKVEDRFKALNVKTETRLSILGQVLSPIRSGAYLSSLEEDSLEHPTKSILHTYTFGQDQVTPGDSNLRALLNGKTLFSDVEATHFVSKIKYGCNTVFKISSQKSRSGSEEGNKVVDEMTSRLRTVLQRLNPGLPQSVNDIKGSSDLQTLTEEEKSQIEALMNLNQIKIKVYSDVQEENSNGRPIEIETAGELKDFLEKSYIPKLPFQNQGKGYPIAYVLHPISNLGPELGFLSPPLTVSFGSLSNSEEDLKAIETNLNFFNAAKSQIRHLNTLIQNEGSDYASDLDKKTVQEIRNISTTAFNSFEKSLKTLITQIKLGNRYPSVLGDCLKTLKSQNLFRDDGYFTRLDELKLFKVKYDEWFNTLKGLNIKYVGGGNTLNKIFGESPNKYLLFYKMEWMNDQATVEAWRNCSATFFGQLSSSVDQGGIGEARENTKLYLVDCDFDYADCEGLTGPTIHEYRNSELITKNFFHFVEQEKSTLQQRMDALNNTVLANENLIKNLADADKQLSLKVEEQVKSLGELETGNSTLKQKLDSIDTKVVEIVGNIETIKTADDQLNQKVEKNIETIGTLQKQLECGVYSSGPPLNNPAIKVQKLGCGGLISIPDLPTSGGSTFVDYKSTETYGSGERCLWAFNTSLPDRSKYNIQMKVTLLCNGFGDSNTALSFLEWSTWDSLTSYNMTNQTTIEPGKSNWLYLSFTSKGDSTGSGFIARIDVLNVTETLVGDNIVYTTETGTHTYGPNKKNDRVAVVVNPPKTSKRTTFSVEKVETYKTQNCSKEDSLYIFEVGFGGSSTKKESLCNVTTNHDYTTSDNNPLLFLYLLSSKETGSGFKLSWKSQ